jgi:hypothetical protein
MEKETSRPAQERPPGPIDPTLWLERLHYAELKGWLKNVIWRGDWTPLIIPPSAVPISYIARLLLRTDARVKTDLRTIIPELLSEWNAYDSREVLEALLILCGDLSCNEAEMVIARIVVHKLGEDDEMDVRCRSRALSTLQSIGTERTLNLFLRYIGHPRHVALCYRGLYRLNPKYAATEMPALVRSYKSRNAIDRLRDVLDLLFNETLTPPEYITVLQPFAEEAEPESFIDVLELLVSIGVFGAPFFTCLSATQSQSVFGQLLKRARNEDCEQIVKLLSDMGMTIEPPPDIESEGLGSGDSSDEIGLDRPQLTPLGESAGDEGFYYLIPQLEVEDSPKKWPFIKSSDVSLDKRWILTRSALPDVAQWVKQASEYVS